MRYNYYYCLEMNPRLIDLLEANKIRYKIHEYQCFGSTDVTFSLWSSSANAETLVEKLSEFCVKGPSPIISIEYSKADLERSRLLVIMPKKQKIEITNMKDSFEFSCERVDSFGIHRVKHMRQIGTLAIAKEPPTETKTALWSSDYGFSEIYADHRVYDLVTSSSLSGINFEKVILKNGTYSNKLYQMTTQHLITKEMISLGHGEKIEKCRMCGKEQFIIDRLYQLHLNNLETIPDSDFYVTDRIFYEGIAEPLYIISQRFYRLLKQNNLTGSVYFSPVVEVSK